MYSVHPNNLRESFYTICTCISVFILFRGFKQYHVKFSSRALRMPTCMYTSTRDLGMAIYTSPKSQETKRGNPHHQPNPFPYLISYMLMNFLSPPVPQSVQHKQHDILYITCHIFTIHFDFIAMFVCGTTICALFHL